MQLIFYAGGAFLTGDDITDALIDYSRALGAEDKADVIRIPIIGDDGLASVATFLIGPASQIATKLVRSSHDDPNDPELVQRLRTLTAAVSFPQGSHFDQAWATGSKEI